MKSARWPFVMNVFEPLMPSSSPSCLACVRIPATSEPASGSVMPRHELFSLRITGARYCCFLLLGAERQDRRGRHVGVDGEALREAAALRVDAAVRVRFEFLHDE